jgi:hypothetical protein
VALTALFLRSRGLTAGGIVVLAASSLVCLALPSTVPLLLGSADLRLRVATLAVILPTLAGAPSLARSLGEGELQHLTRLRPLRALHCALLCLFVGIAALCLASVGAVALAPVAANGLGLLGITLLTTQYASAVPNWFPAMTVVLATYVLGTDPYTGAPRPWAWLLWSSTQSAPAQVLPGMVLLALGAWSFVRSRAFHSTAD